MMRYLYACIICVTFIGCGSSENKREFDYTDNTSYSNESSGQSSSAYSYDEVQSNKLTPPLFEAHKPKNILQMEVQNGVRYVWIEINGIRLKFIFDTGASCICISSAEAVVLFRQGLLREEDFIGSEYFQDATGRISEGTKINLREVKIGNIVLDNIEATVIDNVNAPLLLGQTVLERFGRIEIDNDNNEIIFK